MMVDEQIGVLYILNGERGVERRCMNEEGI